MNKFVAKVGKSTHENHNERSKLLLNEFMKTEAKLMLEIEGLRSITRRSPFSEWQNAFSYQTKLKSRNESPSANNNTFIDTIVDNKFQLDPPTRSVSRLSNKTSENTNEDLQRKKERLFADIQEIMNMKYKPQTMVLEPKSNKIKPIDYDSNKGSVEVDARRQNNNSSLYTLLLTVPDVEINNKTSLPISFDNLSTKGIRGNIASVGAIEPETPYTPIYPIMKQIYQPAKKCFHKRQQ